MHATSSEHKAQAGSTGFSWMTQRSNFWLMLFLAAAGGLFLTRSTPNIAHAQGQAQPTTAKMEFLNQEVQADAIVATMNDLSSQGWEVFQLVPVWSIKNENAETAMSPRGYQVFGRRPVKN